MEKLLLTELERDELKGKINAPVVYARLWQLGGAERASISLSFSLEPKSEWKNGIFENSLYGSFFLHHTGELELRQKCFRIKTKFRKARVKSAADAADRIQAYLDKIKIELDK